MRRKLCVSVVILATLIFFGCKDAAPPMPAEQQVFLDAYHALDLHDYDAYLDFVDMEDNQDTAYVDLLKMVLNQHQEYQTKTKGSVTDVEIVDTKYEADSTCTIFYRLSFSNNASEVSSQKMVCKNGIWKVKLRN